MNLVLSSLYFYLPAAVANSAASLAKYVPFFKSIKTPVDFGVKFKGKRLIGDHKAWGGALFAILAGIVFGVFKVYALDDMFPSMHVMNLSKSQALQINIILSVGAVSGDLIFSFIKRQLGIAAHKPFIPFDEIDHSLVSLTLVKLFYPLGFGVILTIVLLYFILHVLSNLLSWKLKIKEVPY